jgi:hypothetical protein
VGHASDQVRPLFEFIAMKGATYSACWGFSVDFVPTLRGRRLDWKRIAPKAVRDLTIDPVDEVGLVPQWCSFDTASDPAQIARVVDDASEAAMRDFAPVLNRADLLTLFEERSKISSQRFSLANYIQTDIAWGLLLISRGREQEGHGMLAKFCEAFDIKPTNPVLLKACAEAVELARR